MLGRVQLDLINMLKILRQASITACLANTAMIVNSDKNSNVKSLKNYRI
jgi:hypothetical protein